MAFNLEQAVAASLIVEINADDRQLDTVLQRSNEKVKRYAGQRIESIKLTADDKPLTDTTARAHRTLESAARQTVTLKISGDASGVVTAEKLAEQSLRSLGAQRRAAFANEEKQRRDEAVFIRQNTAAEIAALKRLDAERRTSVAAENRQHRDEAVFIRQTTAAINEQARARANAARDAALFATRTSGQGRRELINTASNAALVGGGAILGGVGMAAKSAGDFQSSMVQIANNTTMTDAELTKMKATVIALGKESGASFDDLAKGLTHFMNLGFPAADSIKMLDAAMKSAVATGASVEDTSNVLAKAMKEFALPTSEAAHAMNVLHLAAAQGNGTLSQFSAAVGPAYSMSANLGVSLVDVSAGLVALTRHGYDFSEAATQMHGELAHIINPSNAAKKELEALGKTSGRDLVGDFTLAGLKAKGLGGIMADLQKATRNNEGEILKLIPAFRGGTGALVQAGNGAEDYRKVLLQLNGAMSGKLDPTTHGYNRTLGTLEQQTARANNAFLALYVQASPKLLPFLTTLTKDVTRAADGFSRLSRPVQDGTLNLVAYGGASLLAVGAIGKTYLGLKSLLDILPRVGTTAQATAAVQVAAAEEAATAATASSATTAIAWGTAGAGAIAIVAATALVVGLGYEWLKLDQ